MSTLDGLAPSKPPGAAQRQSSAYSSRRLQKLQRWSNQWLPFRCGATCPFAVAPSPFVPIIYHVPRPQDIGSDYKSAQLKFLPALQFLKTHPDYRSGKVQWVMLVDDDTYVFSRNLILTLPQFGVGTTRYIGHTCPEAVVKKLNGGPSHDFNMGGGGSLLSRLALEKMDLHACIHRQNSTWKRWQSDWMIGACAAEFGIKAETDQRFHQWLSWEGPGPAREHNFAWAVTLHPVRPNHMVQLSALRADIHDVPVLDAGSSPGDPEDDDVAAVVTVAHPHKKHVQRGSDSSNDGSNGGAITEDVPSDTTGSDAAHAPVVIGSGGWGVKRDSEAAVWPVTEAGTPLAPSPGEGTQWPAPALLTADGRQEAPSGVMSVTGANAQARGREATTAGTSAEPPRASETGSTSWTPRLMQQGARPAFRMPEPEQHAVAAHAASLELLDLEQKALQRSGYAPLHMINLVQQTHAGWRTEWDTRTTSPGDGPQTLVVVIR